LRPSRRTPCSSASTLHRLFLEARGRCARRPSFAARHRGQRREELIEYGIDLPVALELLLDAHRIGERAERLLLDLLVELGAIVFAATTASSCRLRFQIFDRRDDLLDRGMRGLERADDLRFRDFLGAGLDHHDAVLRAGDDESSVLCLRSEYVGLMTYSLFTMPTRTPATVFSKGSPRWRAPRGARDRQDVGVVLRVGGHQERDDLRLEAPPEGKSGRIGRSISRLVRISFSAALPSRLKKPPGIRPDA
jgi:hypothetical protein